MIALGSCLSLARVNGKCAYQARPGNFHAKITEQDLCRLAHGTAQPAGIAPTRCSQPGGTNRGLASLGAGALRRLAKALMLARRQAPSMGHLAPIKATCGQRHETPQQFSQRVCAARNECPFSVSSRDFLPVGPATNYPGASASGAF